MDKTPEWLIKGMKNYLDIQGADGNWNYDPYMHGMYNGMELMLSMAEDRDPVYKDAPEGWLSDNPVSEHSIADYSAPETTEQHNEVEAV